MININLYELPFQMDGEDVMAFKRGDDIVRLLSGYKLAGGEYTTDESFSSGQDRIVFDDASTGVTKANYIIVTNTESPEDPFFFWVTRWEIYANPNRMSDPPLYTVAYQRLATLIAYITPDYITQCIFARDDVSTGYEIEGFMLQATGTRTVINPDETGRGIVPRTVDFPRSRNADNLYRRTIDAGESDGFYFVVAFTTEDGAVQTAWVKAKSSNIEDFVVECFGISNLATLKPRNSDASHNIKISRIYAIPVAWTKTSFPNFKPVSYDLVSQDGKNTWPANFVAVSGGDFGANAEIQIFQDNLEYLFDPYSSVYLFTPSRVIEIQDPTCQRRIDIFLGVGAEYGSDQISVTMLLDGKTYDITDDFLIDFAINEQSLWQEQHGQEVVLNKVAAAIGGIGGVVGGVVSGNYFGAVQSLVGGVSSFVGMDSGLKDPAVQKGQGSFLTTYVQRSHIFALILSGHTQRNDPYMEYVKRYGYTLTEPVFVRYKGYPTDDPSTLLYPSADLGDDPDIGFFLKMSNVTIRRMAMGFSEDAANYIKARLEAGVRFRDPLKIPE